MDYEQLSTHALPEAQQRLLVGGINLNLSLKSQDESQSTKTCSKDNSNRDDNVPDNESTNNQHYDPIVELPDDCSTLKTNQTGESKVKTILNPVSVTTSPLPMDVAAVAPPSRMRVVPPMRMSSFEREALFPAGRFDTDGQQLDLRRTNTWRTVLEEVPVGELLEVNYMEKS